MKSLKILTKNRNRSFPVFANINFLGKCNANCYFCLGKDIETLLFKQNRLNIHFSKWHNFSSFLDLCNQLKIRKIYLTGLNTDPLLYSYLEELIFYLQNEGFLVGIRTNGYLAKQKIDTINKCNEEIGYSIHSLNPETNYKIMGRKDIPDWNFIIPNTNNVRVSIVLNRHNINEFWDLLYYISKFENVKYIQARRICSDTRIEEFEQDMQIYENLYSYVEKRFQKLRDFYSAQHYLIFGKEISFWKTTETTINSINYYTDGTLTDNYFVIEGYLKSFYKTNKED